MGSVHHVHTIPIDYDQAFYQRAREIAGGTDEKLFEDYFDSQFDMLKVLKPVVVGHFDLIRLKSDDPDRNFSNWPGVWKKILRNLDWITEYGGILELNSAALRKGLKEPYPGEEICKVNHLEFYLSSCVFLSSVKAWRGNVCMGLFSYFFQLTIMPAGISCPKWPLLSLG